MPLKIVLDYDENTQSVGFSADRPLQASLAISILSTIITDLSRKMTAAVHTQPSMTKENVRLVQKLRQ